ncbi:mitochondrial inner membrane protein Mitofilin [Rhodotorula toruloides]|uniref:MICOS complex subunit MIC60 n=1 Tax=Rhodotorula toruloides TaxID=5286 RepID=A0A511K993_RHOTO|nr:mitochondrial inner membrane protein Mitofilin [Rhodotorula toruloides]
MSRVLTARPLPLAASLRQAGAGRGFATAPSNSNVFPNPGPAGPTPSSKPRRSLTRRVLSPLILLTVAFYGLSVPLGYVSLRYRDFLVEAVPGGEQIGELLDELQIQRAAVKPGEGRSIATGNQSKETELTRYAESKAKAEGWNLKKADPSDPAKAREEIKQKIASAAKTVEEKSKDKVADLVEAAKARASEAKQVAVKAESVVEDKAKEIVSAAKDLAPAASSPATSTAVPAAKTPVEPASALPIYAQRPRDVDATPVPPKRANKEVYQGPPLPIGFEPPVGYELPRAPPTPKGEIKPASPPPAPLPLVAPALKDVTTSEPMLGQLASTIDSLAKYVEKHDVTVSESASTVLNDAQKDIKSLASRLEAIKKQEEEKLQAQLKEQASKYSGMLLKAEKELVERLDTQEEDWKKAFDEERQRLVSAYKEKLDNELATQQEIINQRLKEEVVAQGIELQRRWVSEIKMRVEQERGGRLAKLEELESGVRKLEKVAKENEEALGEAVRARKIFTAVKALENRIESGLPFTDELATLQRLAKETSSPSLVDSASDSLLSLALSTIPADAASTGIASFPALSARFASSVAPQLKKVSLYREHGGVFAYLTSCVASHALFEKEGWADGEDVVSTIARVKFWLANKDLDLATREVNSLKGWPKALASDWLQQARKHLEVKQALEIAEREATAQNLSAV